MLNKWLKKAFKVFNVEYIRYTVRDKVSQIFIWREVRKPFIWSNKFLVCAKGKRKEVKNEIKKLALLCSLGYH